MNLANRLKQLELKIRPVEAEEERHFDFDEYVPRLVLGARRCQGVGTEQGQQSGRGHV